MSAQTSFKAKVAPGVDVTFQAERLVYQVKSSAHEKLVIDNAHFGRMMMIDGAVQLSSTDAFIDHEMMSHVPLLAHGHVERVLIVGGGHCGLAAEALKHRSIRRLVQVESDPQVVRLARSYFAGLNASVFSDNRFHLHIGDGADFVATTDERFDLILVNCIDPGGGGLCGSTEAFYRHARGCLKAGGLLIAQLGAPFLQGLAFSAAIKRLASVFPAVSCYLASVPCMFGGPLAFGWASNVLNAESPGLDVLTARFASARITARYYTPEVHRAAFALPRYLKDAVVAAIRPHEEDGSAEHRRADAAGVRMPAGTSPGASRFPEGVEGGTIRASHGKACQPLPLRSLRAIDGQRDFGSSAMVRAQET